MDNHKIANQNRLYYRIASSSVILIMHIRNSISLMNKLNDQVSSNPELKKFVDLSQRYVTVWNMYAQVIYAIIALACDLSSVLNKDSLIPKKLRTFRNTFFYGIIYPVGMSVGFVFWPYYLYDRELIFPKISDLTVSFPVNVMCHGVVSVYSLIELILMSKDSKKDVNKPEVYIHTFNFLYVFGMLYTRYGDLGIWAYPGFTMYEGTVTFYLLFSHPVVSFFLFYYTQLPIQDAIWKYMSSTKKNV